jgi:hypothetical protein
MNNRSVNFLFKYKSDFILDIQKKEEEIFTSALRKNSVPPINGKITKGKIKWRGIRIVQYNEGFKRKKWLEQRGKQISSIIIFDEMKIISEDLKNSSFSFEEASINLNNFCKNVQKQEVDFFSKQYRKSL